MDEVFVALMHACKDGDAPVLLEILKDGVDNIGMSWPLFPILPCLFFVCFVLLFALANLVFVFACLKPIALHTKLCSVLFCSVLDVLFLMFCSGLFCS